MTKTYRYIEQSFVQFMKGHEPRFGHFELLLTPDREFQDLDLCVHETAYQHTQKYHEISH